MENRPHIRILLMEDDDGMAGMIEEVIGGAGREVVRFPDASSAWFELVRAHYDLVVTDIFVKADDGYQPDGGISLIGKIRSPRNRFDPKLSWLCELPIIAISGGLTRSSGFNPLAQSESMGANIAIAKPASASELRDAVDRLLPRLAA